MLAKLARPQSMGKSNTSPAALGSGGQLSPGPALQESPLLVAALCLVQEMRCPAFAPACPNLPQHRLHHSDIISRSGASVSKLDSDSDSPRPGASAAAIKSDTPIPEAEIDDSTYGGHAGQTGKSTVEWENPILVELPSAVADN